MPPLQCCTRPWKCQKRGLNFKYKRHVHFWSFPLWDLSHEYCFLCLRYIIVSECFECFTFDRLFVLKIFHNGVRKSNSCGMRYSIGNDFPKERKPYLGYYAVNMNASWIHARSIFFLILQSFYFEAREMVTIINVITCELKKIHATSSDSLPDIFPI